LEGFRVLAGYFNLIVVVKDILPRVLFICEALVKLWLLTKKKQLLKMLLTREGILKGQW
jgi:hypothetical protein